ncbi:MAG: hypothetical protein ABW202_00695 [Duganella sp.]
MTVLLRSLIVWFLLLALPYQGYAAAAMMLCAPASTATASMTHMVMPDGPHDHAAMLAAMAQHQSMQSHAHDDTGAHHDSTSHASHGAKCSGAACCVASAPVLASLAVLPALPALTGPIAWYPGYLPAVDLAHPERPPQAPMA